LEHSCGFSCVPSHCYDCHVIGVAESLVGVVELEDGIKVEYGEDGGDGGALGGSALESGAGECRAGAILYECQAVAYEGAYLLDERGGPALSSESENESVAHDDVEGPGYVK
jgi:hypothetical protein